MLRSWLTLGLGGPEPSRNITPPSGKRLSPKVVKNPENTIEILFYITIKVPNY